MNGIIMFLDLGDAMLVLVLVLESSTLESILEKKIIISDILCFSKCMVVYQTCIYTFNE